MVLVTGANGWLGVKIVRALREVDASVRCLVRQRRDYWWLNEFAVSYRFGDLRDRGSLRRACKGQRFLVAASGIRMEGRAHNHRLVTALGHRNLWKAAFNEGVERVVYISCLGVGRGFRGAAYDARRQAEESLQESGLDYVILRPSLYVEELARMALAAEKRGFAVMPGPGRNPVSPIAQRDVALHAVAALGLEAVTGRAVELGGPETLPMAEALDRSLSAAGLPRARRLGIPRAGVLGGQLLLDGLNRRWANRLRETSSFFQGDLSVDPRRAAELFGIGLTPLDDALRDALAEARLRADPNARIARSHTRKPAAAPYEPGIVPVSQLPDGPPPPQD